jgi:hypothetical protein
LYQFFNFGSIHFSRLKNDAKIHFSRLLYECFLHFSFVCVGISGKKFREFLFFFQPQQIFENPVAVFCAFVVLKKVVSLQKDF